MFGKNHLSVIALAGAVSAVRIQREPLLASENNVVREVFMIPHEKDHPIDYAVADFGMDHEIKYSLNNTGNSEKTLKHKLNFMNDDLKMDEYPVDYPVASFGQDPEITTTLNNMQSAEVSLKHKFTVEKESVLEDAPAWTNLVSLDREPLISNSNELEVHQRPAYSDYPTDYVVPNFGMDHEIKYTENNIKLTETLLKHKLNFMNDDLKKDEYPMNYKVADFGVDEDVKYTQKNIGNAEQSLGQKMTADFGQDKNGENPRNYFVPDFGVSEEILYTQNNIKNSEKRFKRKLNVSWDQTENGVNPRDYKVPNFGLDQDIKTSLSNLDLEQGIHGRWNLEGFPEPAAEKADDQAVAAEPSINVVEKELKKQEDNALQADKDVQSIPTTENTSETTDAGVQSPPVAAADLTEAIDQQTINATDLNDLVNGNVKIPKKGKGKTGLSKSEKSDRKAKNDDAANDDDKILGKKLLQQAAERKAIRKQKKADAKAAKAKANGIKKQNEIKAGVSSGISTSMMFVQTESEGPKDIEAPTNQSLVKPVNWDPVAHTWFAQAPKDSDAPTNQSLVKPMNWDPVAHTWFAQAPKNIEAPTNQSLVKPKNWDPVSHQWF